jgi:citronellol/citronellal dehydrogenase
MLVSSLLNKTVVITGASRGIGRQLALYCARDGANVVLLSRSGSKPSHHSLEGDIQSVARLIHENGGVALPIRLDIRDGEDVRRAIDKTVSNFGGVDVLINNASALCIDKHPSMKYANFIFDVNIRGTANLLTYTFDHLIKSELRHVLSISPPLHTLQTKWLTPHPAYTTSKYAMSMLTIGYSDLLRANTIWPKKLIATAATKMIEKKTGLTAFSDGLSAHQFSHTVHKIIRSDMKGYSCLDNDIISVGNKGIDDIFID